MFGVLGPNGSGKTTLFRILTTVLRPSSGQVRVFGHDAVSQPDAVRRKMGVVFQKPSLDLKLTAEENLKHQGKLYGLNGPTLQRQIDALLIVFALQDRRGEMVEQFSGGMRRRVELAKAMLHRPKLLILDEPASGLDPGARRDLARYLQQLKEEDGLTIGLTTHLMDEADRCDRLAVFNEGRLVTVDTPLNLKGRVGGDVVIVEPDQNTNINELCQYIEQHHAPFSGGSGKAGSGQPRIQHDRIHLALADGAAFVAPLLRDLGPRVRSITVGKPTLEDVFLHLTGHTFYGRDET